MMGERYVYSEDIESVVDMKNSTDELGLEMTTADVLKRLNQLEEELELYKEAERQIAQFGTCLEWKEEIEVLREYISAVLEEALPIIHSHQVRNINNQTQFPRCKKAWENIPESVRAILETDSILKLAKGEPI